jgi:hypothetical protein
MTTKNIVLDWASNVRGAEYGFIKAVIYALEQFGEKNNKPIYTMIAICNGKAYDKFKIVQGDRLAYATPLRRILNKALANVTFTFKDGKASVKVGDNGGLNSDILEALRMLVTIPGMSIRHAKFKEMFPAEQKKGGEKPKDEVAKVEAKRIAKTLKDKGLTMADVIDLLRAEMALVEEPAH